MSFANYLFYKFAMAFIDIFSQKLNANAKPKQALQMT